MQRHAPRTGWLALAAMAGVLLYTGAAAAERRVALVIGNAAYTGAGIRPLNNAVNDANAITSALRSIGFRVETLKDAGKGAIDRAIDNFRDQLRDADIGLFYYSGHGFQTSRADLHHPVNHIVPVDFRLPAGQTLENTVPLDNVLSAMAAARVSLVFMDACRNAPELEKAARQLAAGNRSVNLQRGFAPVAIPAGAGRSVRSPLGDDRPSGMLIAYAAAPGTVASDGEGQLSPFTKSVLQNIGQPGVPITDIMGQVKKDVQSDTNNRQHVWSTLDLTGPVYLVPKPRRPPGTVIPP